MVICEKILIHRGSQITTDASWDHLGHPCNKVIMKNVQTQDSDISISHLGQFLKSNPCLMPFDIIDFSKMFPFFFNFQNEYVVASCYTCTLRLPHCNAHCQGFVGLLRLC